MPAWADLGEECSRKTEYPVQRPSGETVPLSLGWKQGSEWGWSSFLDTSGIGSTERRTGPGPSVGSWIYSECSGKPLQDFKHGNVMLIEM